MTLNAILQLMVYLGTLLALAWPLGWAIERLFRRCDPEASLSRVEQALFRLLRIDPTQEMRWQTYGYSLIAFSGFGVAAVYAIQRLQAFLPLNPEHLPNVAADLAFNTAASFVTNTNWQAYSGESSLSYFTQMTALTVQNFASAASGIAVLFALMRGLTRARSHGVGNFWRDCVLITTHCLLPLSFLFSIVLVSQGVVQSFEPYQHVVTVEGKKSGSDVAAQTIPMGPAASQIAIKQLGTNGGGYFGVNSAHPFENPNSVSNFFEMIAILLIPAALCHTFGRVVKDTRQGWVLLRCMLILFLLFCIPTLQLESHGNHLLPPTVNQQSSALLVGGNMEGKEMRFGVTNSALWAVATTAASNGSVNAMHDSFTPLGGMMPMILMQLGEVVFGGVGSGLYGLIAFAIVAVFIAGLMVGRTPEYLGKKISAFEMKMVSIAVLLPCALVLLSVALVVEIPEASSSVSNPGPHGFSQILYAYSSMGNNNGSAFAGFAANTPFHNIFGACVMFVSRFWIAVPMLALAGALANKPIVPQSAGTLRTDTGLFVFLLTSTVLIVGALTFIPALALGPIAEHLMTLEVQ